MSIISHIVNHLNSLIQCRTISVDLTSKYFAETIIYDVLERCSLRLVNRTYVDAVTQCWQTLTFHKLKYNIGGCRSPNFAKDCIKSTIHGLLSVTKGAGKRS